MCAGAFSSASCPLAPSARFHWSIHHVTVTPCSQQERIDWEEDNAKRDREIKAAVQEKIRRRQQAKDRLAAMRCVRHAFASRSLAS